MQTRTEVQNPFTDELLSERPFQTSDALEAGLLRARSAFEAWREVALEERVARLGRGLDWFQEHAEEVALGVTCQMGKPLQQARNEVQGLLERGAHMLAIAPEALAPRVLPEQGALHRRIQRVPLGVVLNVAAWNYPLLIPINVVLPALAAGNVVLLKHSRRTPLTGEHFACAFSDLGVPDVLQNPWIDHAQTEALVRDERVEFVAFTGSVPGGRAIQRAARERFVEVGLELGGKDPAYVAADADLEQVVPAVVDGACYNAGQSCCAVERVYVHASRQAEFLARAQPLLESYVLGDPLAAETTLGPLADAGAIGFLESQVRDAVERGARLLFGGHGVDGRFFLPTLLADCPQDARVMQEESFGPLLPVRSVADDEEALRCMNDSELGLTASVWTASRARAEWFAARLQAGTVFQNRCDYLDPGLAWTGFKNSGQGVTLSALGYDHLTRAQSVHLRTRFD